MFLEISMGTRVAQRQGLPVTGLLGVLLEAKRRSIIPSLDRNRHPGCYQTSHRR